MYNKTITKYISNPIIGLFPFMLYIILHTLAVREWCALLISLVFSVICEYIIRKTFQSRAFSLAYYILNASFLITFIFSLLIRDTDRYGRNIYIVICEISIVCLYILLRISKTYIRANWLRNKSLNQKALLDRFYFSASIIQYALTIHLFSILIYKFLKTPDGNYAIFDLIIFTIAPCIFIIGLFIYEMAKVNNIWARLGKEEWLPIITPKGEVTGKIAKSVSLKMKNKFLHPVVRVALVCKGKVFLQERPENDVLSPGKLDYPFEKYILFKHDHNVAARNSIAQMLCYEDKFPLSFLLKYEFDNDNTKRLNIVYVSEIEDEDIVKRNGRIFGKFWSMKQIENSFADEIFSECFELEYEYLKNKVLIKSEDEKEKIASPVL